MKVTFIDPPDFLNKKNIERVFGCTYSLYPIPNIFSLTMAAVLEKEGFRVNYIDMANEGWRLNRFREFLKTDDSNAYCFHSVNLSKTSDLRAASEIKDIKKDVFIIFTGPAPTYFPEDFLKDKNSFAIRGESEFSLLELMRCLKQGKGLSKIDGLSFIQDNSVINNPPGALADDLDRLPFPARHLLKKDLYCNPKLPKRPFTAMQTSRNCPYQCIFCVPNSYNFARELEYRKHNQNRKPPVRVRSAENVIEEFKILKKEGYKSISIIDDQFLWDEARTLNICHGVRGLGIEWGCLARADHITEKTAQAMAEAHCRYVDMGVESFDQAILNDIGKNLKIEKVYEAVDILKRHKILVKINLILGASPLQTEGKIKDDIQKAKNLGVDSVMFSIAAPFPGTGFYQRAKANNWFVDGYYHPESVQKSAIIEYPGLSSKNLSRIIKMANLSFFFNPRFIIKNLWRLAYPRNVYYSLIALKRKFI
ncbi:MAG: radical SAM protein [Candidatus Omnitrophica bacterium]|nr:radical SAM protein [Candidatus Omnitrophota bacterium]